MSISGIRFGGIASGLDTESIVKQLMQVERMKVDRFAKQKQLLEWQRDEYRDINTRLLALRNAVFDLRLQGSFTAKKLVSSDENRLVATAGSGSIEGNYDIVIKQLATGITVESNYAGDAGLVDGKLVSGGTFKLNGVEITLTEGDSVANIASKINAQSSQTKVKATYDADKGLFYLMSTNTGSEARVDITDSEFSDISFLANAASGPGQNAVITFNGGSDIEFASNQFTFNNITFNLKKADPATTVTLSVERDVDAVVAKIKTFIEAYNSVMEKIDTELGEKRYRDFPPLTAEQREAMSEKEIEQWEEKAKSGLLRGDSLLAGVYSNIRMAAGGGIEGSGAYRTLSSIGIGTVAWYDQGKLYVNEEKLKEALTKDLDGVMKLFTATEENDGVKGMASKLYDTLGSAMQSLTDKAGKASSLVDQSSIGLELDRVNDRLQAMEDYLLRVEERHWAKFTALERALQQMQSQSDWLMAQLGGSNQK